MPIFDEAAAVEAMARKMHDALRAYVIKLCDAPITGRTDQGMFEFACSLCDHYWRPNCPEEHSPDCLAALAALKPFLGGIPASKESLHAIPEGWVCVPKEPTAAMLDARYEIDNDEYIGIHLQGARELWAGMLAAAPSPDKGGE